MQKKKLYSFHSVSTVITEYNISPTEILYVIPLMIVSFVGEFDI